MIWDRKGTELEQSKNKMHDEVVSMALDGLSCKPSGAFLAGGALTSVFTGRPINDWDLYFKSRKAFEAAVQEYHGGRMWLVSASTRALTYKCDKATVQFMHFDFFETPESIFSCFDFTCCMAAIDLDSKELHYDKRFPLDTNRRRLVFNSGTRYPIGSAVRVEKFRQRGYSIDPVEWLKVLAAVAAKKIETIGEFADQVGGQYGDKVLLAGSPDAPFTAEAACSLLDTGLCEIPHLSKKEWETADSLLAHLNAPSPAQPAEPKEGA